MTTKRIILPREKFRLEEINLPEELAASLAGKEVTVEVLPEERPLTRRLDLNTLPDALPVLIDEEGVAWNDHWPVRVLHTDACGRVWRLPRHWLSGIASPVIETSRYEVTHELRWLEIWHPPTWFDLCDVNLPGKAAAAVRGKIWIQVSVVPGEIAKVFWKDPSGKVRRIPHDWRRRRIRLTCRPVKKSPDSQGRLAPIDTRGM